MNYLFRLGILDFLWWKKIPVRVQTSGLLFHIINENAVGSIRTKDEGIHMRQLVSFTRNILLNQVVCVIVCKDSMYFFGAISTDIRSKHDTTRRNILHMISKPAAFTNNK